MSASKPAMTTTPTLQSIVGGLSYAKGHGTGNDFVLISDPADEHRLEAEQVAALCDRHRGIGADGLIRAVPSSSLAEGREVLETSPEAYWFMDYRNGDGSVSEMCGNGVRVFVHFLLSEKLVELPVGEQLAIGTRAGVKLVTRLEDGYAVDMGPWEFIFEQAAKQNGLDSKVSTAGLGNARGALSISMGNPHTVVALANAGELENLELFAIPEVQPLPPHGTNVEYVLAADPVVQDGVGSLRMRVHERGVGETLSCGTGACAAAAATRHWAQAQDIRNWKVQVPGGEVGIEFIRGATGREHVVLSGPAVLVSRGRITEI
ncbi:diaminopimelate epimerase [Paeniglutamicibacter sulfureus]|uniref:Diaminopimelate epimerase n=1 Tax=Paeniglutamicibacter sulfureus TaxID=43666 RepID=A0ABU2BIG6_9MICC|nr:diaminopimelate epimerase [Paeniglutamicibacter sulfureus]MDR7357169.1 diaminopimelate epimerase [Paeniglutamicibacter sulfureus]